LVGTFEEGWVASVGVEGKYHRKEGGRGVVRGLMGFMMMIMMMVCCTATYNIVMIIVFDVLGFFFVKFSLVGAS